MQERKPDREPADSAPPAAALELAQPGKVILCIYLIFKFFFKLEKLYAIYQLGIYRLIIYSCSNLFKISHNCDRISELKSLTAAVDSFLAVTFY